MLIQKGFAEVNGTRLYYEVAGAGQPLVLVHGFTLDRRMWDDQFEAFAQSYRVVRYDARGFGQSAAPTESYAHTDDLRALLTHLDIASAHVIGLSMGGSIAIDFALVHPEMTRALIPVDAVLGGYRFSRDSDTSYDPIWERGRAGDVMGAKQVWLAHALFAPANEQSLVAARLAQMINDYSGWHFLNRNPLRTPNPAAAQRLHEIKAPTLIVLGERDLPDFHAIADLMTQQIPHARKAVLAKVGHMANMEDPAGFNTLVMDFLAQAT